MNIYPHKQLQLFGFNDNFREFVSLFKENNLPNKILLSGPNGIGKSTFAYHLINYVFSLNEDNKYNLDKNTISENNKSFKLIQNNVHPNFFLIDIFEEKKNIEINQIRTMIEFNNKSSFNNKPRFILIDNVDCLNINSSNALLKILEEPNENIIFLLIYNNAKKIKETIKSRCINFKLNLKNSDINLVVKKLLGNSIEEVFNKDLINFYNSPGFYINLFNFAENNNIDIKENNLHHLLSLIIEKNLYKKSAYLKNTMPLFIELYFLNLITNSENKKLILQLFSIFTTKMNNLQKFNLDYESFFLEFKSKVLNG